MKTKQLKGKAIYSPKGKAGEYAKYACNFYVGCSNDCDYCYCKRGLQGHAMGGTTPTLKKCFKDEHDAYKSFIREVQNNINEFRKHGIFFTFTSDTLLPETQQLTNTAVLYAVAQGVPCKLLTKRADFKIPQSFYDYTDLIAYGFTLTGINSLELHASTNAKRIDTMRHLHNRGFKTFASIEPIINLKSSMAMIKKTVDCCNLYKIGLISGEKLTYTWFEVERFYMEVNDLLKYNMPQPKVYWKNSLLKYIDRDRVQLLDSIFVNADYNIFNNK